MCDYVVKVILIGDTGVGKSCLLTQFACGSFLSTSSRTIGIDFGSRQLSVAERVVKVQVWDTAGMEAFRSITRSYYRGACAVIIVYDVTDRGSFDNLHSWIVDTTEYCHADTLRVLVGTKCDAENNRQVTSEEAHAFMDTYGIDDVYETSAKSRKSVELLFTNGIIIPVLRKVDDGLIDDIDGGQYGVRRGTRALALRNPQSCTITRCCR
jgi:small GTP-binding protein